MYWWRVYVTHCCLQCVDATILGVAERPVGDGGSPTVAEGVNVTSSDG